MLFGIIEQNNNISQRSIVHIRDTMDSGWNELLDSKEKIAERRKVRSRAQLIKRVNVGEEDDWIKCNYVHDPVRSNKRTSYLTYDKSQDELFEDYVWICFSNLGFKYMSSNQNFKIRYSSDSIVEPQQIDVFAADDDVAIVVECKSAKTFEKKTQFKDTILTFSAQRDNIVREIKSHFNNDEMAVSFVFVTNNYLISESDMACAKDVGVIMLNQDDIDYYYSLYKNIGEAAKYHVLADVFEKQTIPSMDLHIPAIQGKYNGVTIYSFLIEPSKLLPISYVAHRVKNSKSTEMTYQRMIKKSRITNIRKYIETEKSIFPNSIIVNIDSELCFDEKSRMNDMIASGTLELPNRYKSAWIIDGQHRLFSYCGTEEASTSFIPVVAFEKLSYTKQSEMFIDINSKQTKVDKNLLLEINSESHFDSDKPEEWLDALISKCILRMSKEETNPLYSRLKLYTEETGGELTITSLTTAISKTGLFGQMTGGQLQFGPLSSPKNKISDTKSSSLERGYYILTGYLRIFSTIAENNWKKRGGKGKGYLCTNNGTTSLIYVLRDLLKYIDEHPDKVIDLDERTVIERISPYAKVLANYFRDKEENEPEIIDRYRSMLGAHGQQQNTMDMEVAINEAYPEFDSADLRRHKENTDKMWEEKTKELFPEVKRDIIQITIKALKSTYGETVSGWWKKGVPEEVRVAIGSLKESDEEERDYEFYFSLKDVKAIISSKDWKRFKPVFGMKTYGSKKEEQIKWLDSLSRIDDLITKKIRVTKEEYDKVLEVRALLQTKNVDEELMIDPGEFIADEDA